MDSSTFLVSLIFLHFSSISSVIGFSTPHIKATMSNPAADPRQMRRIIAEDPEWQVPQQDHNSMLA